MDHFGGLMSRVVMKSLRVKRREACPVGINDWPSLDHSRAC
jgi:hypothetical protein